MKIDKNLNNKCGIYLIRCIISNNFYIGSSKNIYQRLHKHRTFLKRNNHQNCILQNAVNKNGLDNFKVEILEFCSSLDLIEREQYYINTLNPKYNITKNVIRNNLSEDSRKKISLKLKQLYKEGLPLQNNKKIYCFDWKGNFLKEFESMRSCSKILKVSETSISRVLKGEIPRIRDFIFSETSYTDKKLFKRYVLIDLLKKEYAEFDTLKGAAKFIGMEHRRKPLEAPYTTGKIYLNRYKIVSSSCIKLGELLEGLEAVNQQPSLGSA